MPKYTNIYITIGDFSVLQGMGRPYEGFIIGVGYAYVLTHSQPPPNLHGFTYAHKVPPQLNRYTLVKNQFVDNSPEMIELSMSGITPKGELLYTVQRGDTLTNIARQYKVSVDDLIHWNKLYDPDKIQVGQKLIVSEESRDLLGKYIKTLNKSSQDISNLSLVSDVSRYDNESSYSGLGLSPYNLIGPSLIFLGSPIIPKYGGLAGGGNAGRWTSIASKSLRWVDRTVQGSLKTNVKFPAGGAVARYFGTRGIGAVAGRAIPYVGWAWTAWDVGFYLGEQYGISQWDRLHREYRERRTNERLIEAIRKKYEEENSE